MASRLSPILEDYLESILILEQKKGAARLKDIATAMEVKAPSALEALANLESQGLVHHESYGGFDLTKQGKRMAKEVYARHLGLKNFLMTILGVAERTAERDACQIEHYLSATTVKKITQFSKK